jgi:Luciferase
MASIRETIEREVKGWPGVDARAHRFGGVEFRVNGHEIGHLHGDRMADLPFPVRMREELVESGKAQLHHVLPQTGWVSYYLSGEEDVPGALDLFKKNYDRLTARKSAGASGRTGRRGASDISEDADPGKE